jgi:hypothetical protein
MLRNYITQNMSSGDDCDDHLSAVTRDWLAMTKKWVNADNDHFGFAALDERKPPAEFLEVFNVPPHARSLTLASDGAVVSPNGQRGPEGIADMLAAIAAVKTADPYCLDLFPYWRGFLPGANLLDDTSLVRIEVGG